MAHVLITGASSGIGLELARRYAARGDSVSMLARRVDSLETEAEAIRQQGGKAAAIRCDVTDRADVGKAVASAESTFGPVDLAIANAGIGYPTRVTSFDLAAAVAIMDTNFYGTLHLFDAVVPAMMERRSGRFVGVASLAGLRGLPGSTLYSASKAAMQAFLEGSRVELAPFDVGVTIVNPGFIETPMTDKNRFRMPFLMKVEPAAEVIMRGVDRGARVVEFPRPMSLLVRLLRVLPGPIFDRVTVPYSKRTVDEIRRNG